MSSKTIFPSLARAVFAASAALCVTAQAQSLDSALPFAKQTVTLGGKTIGEPLAFASANPLNFEQILSGAQLAPVQLDGQLFLPAGKVPHPVVILTPGSGGVELHHLKHAQALLAAGIGVYVLDPFAARGVKSTSADQTQFPFAASVYDILAAAKMLMTLPAVDKDRLGALGYSRGGLAVNLAVSEKLSQAVLGKQFRFKAVMSGWAWCGYQFENAATTATAIRFALADSDAWGSVAVCQTQAVAMAQRNPNVSVRLFKNAQHGFGYDIPVKEIPDALKAYNAPVIFINDKGSFVDFYTGKPIPAADDRAILRVAAPWITRGVKVGSQADQSEAFTADAVLFFKQQLGS